MAKWKLIKDGAEIGEISSKPDNEKKEDTEKYYHLILEHLMTKTSLDYDSYSPEQPLGEESDFGILLTDGSYVKAVLVKEPEHKFKVGGFVESDGSYNNGWDYNSIKKGEKCKVLQIGISDNTDDMIVELNDVKYPVHSKHFKLWEEPKEKPLEEWFKAQNFGDEFILVKFPTCYELIIKPGQYYQHRICVALHSLPLDRQKRIIQKHIELYR